MPESHAEYETRLNLTAFGYWAIQNRSMFHYAEVRPIPNVGVRQLPITTDCSGLVTILYRWAGLPDPNGVNYDGQGYTGTLLQHLPHCGLQDTKRGDLVVFGPGTGQHVVMLLEGGMYNSNPLVVSHGQEGDPGEYHLNDEESYFGTLSPVTFLKMVML